MTKQLLNDQAPNPRLSRVKTLLRQEKTRKEERQGFLEFDFQTITLHFNSLF
jgi:hypothetical protein